MPKFGDGFVFPRHAEDFFEFAVEIVAGGEEFFEALIYVFLERDAVSKG